MHKLTALAATRGALWEGRNPMRLICTLTLTVALASGITPVEAQTTDRAVGTLPQRDGGKLPVLRPGTRPSGGRVTPKGRRTNNPDKKRTADKDNKQNAPDDEGVVRTRSKKAGVLDTKGKKKLDFDPKRLGKKTPTEVATEKLENQAEDVIEW